MNFSNNLFKKILCFSVKTGIIHSHRDLNSESSSTERTNLLEPMTSSLRSPLLTCASHHVQLPQALEEALPWTWNQRHVIRSRVDDHSHRWPECVNMLPLLDRESWRILFHSVEPPLDHESTVSTVQGCALIIFPRPMWKIELLLGTCDITWPASPNSQGQWCSGLMCTSSRVRPLTWFHLLQKSENDNWCHLLQ